ncbi:MAG: elongation factor P--(R)-beta-lysine ligase [Thermoanaerobaculia bacterium]|nr:elongation factor P--(R)-beta-lysine ligase [Thermoanaerobaculia bacterium]
MTASWQPTASFETLRFRAGLLADIRRFFADRGVLEVETPLLASAPVTDPRLASFSTVFRGPGAPTGQTRFLQTSPEFAMKRLLAAGSGPIFQISKAFRDGEAGRRHNPEFTLLEWYRPGFDHHRLMDEMDELLGGVLATPPAERLTYREAFLRHVGLDPLVAPVADLQAAARTALGSVPELGEDRDGWLDLLVSLVVEPHLGHGRPTYLTDYPASQAALARLRPDDPRVAERFEVYVEGIELANGFHELGDAAEQRRRFVGDLTLRAAEGLPEVPLDEALLAALAAGLPPCAGVALGFDRLVMVARGARELAEVMAFPWARA